MSAVGRFAGMPPSRRRLLVRALLAVSGFRVALTVLPVESRPRDRVAAAGNSRPAARDAGQLAWSVTAVGRRPLHLPDEALALQALLLSEGHDATLPARGREGGHRQARSARLVGERGRVLIGGPSRPASPSCRSPSVTAI